MYNACRYTVSVCTGVYTQPVYGCQFKQMAVLGVLCLPNPGVSSGCDLHLKLVILSAVQEESRPKDLNPVCILEPLGSSSLEEGMATHFSILVCRIQWTEEPGRLQSMELQRVRHD